MSLVANGNPCDDARAPLALANGLAWALRLLLAPARALPTSLILSTVRVLARVASLLYDRKRSLSQALVLTNEVQH